MKQLKIEHKLSSLQIDGPARHMKQIICPNCGVKIRFMTLVPYSCTKCMQCTQFPKHLYAHILDRLDYHEGVN